ncbi:MAG: primosomal protein N', partial [Bacteroidetes bacterium]|nr:primosomal protein N' [Bacteroidota bacterium]
AEQLQLTKWISEYYLCGWGEAARASLPPGVDTVSEYRIQKCPDEDTGPLSEIQKQLLSFIPTNSTVSLTGLRKTVPEVSLDRLRGLESRGFLRIERGLRGPRTRVLYDQFVRLAGGAPEHPLRGIRQQAVMEAMMESDASSGILQSQLLQKTGATSSTIRRLADLGLLAVEKREIDRSARNGSSGKSTSRIELNEHQKVAVDAITTATAASGYQTFLLHGITGSGKTEVYIESLKKVRECGKSGIILVPEISLTPQTVQRFRSRFGNEIAVLHSRMGSGERFDAWRRIRSGQYPIVIGPRSAILAPVSNLGLIVVDEEHESSYKQFDPAPRYHARDVAVMRAQLSHAICVLGSATPSLESLANAQNQKYTLLSMPERVETNTGKAVLPDVRIVDLRTERNPDEPNSSISKPLREAIRLRLAKNQQVILLQNRRGYAPSIRCHACKWTPECPDCSVSMTYHKAKRHLRCHYCGRTAGLPRSCPDCGAAVSQLGIGTQRVEEELEATFPDAVVARMDLDTTSAKDSHHKILEDFANGKSNILLGTQMVAKGLDFERVTLVGVIDADTGLSLPDIRAEERSFHLLTQVAGRAGRADLPGEVFFQTRNPGHRIIQFALRHDYERFARELLDERRALGYPPEGKLVAVLFSGPVEHQVMAIARRWSQIATELDPEIHLLGPSASYIGKVRKQYRVQVMIKIGRGDPHKRVREVIRRTNDQIGTPPKGYRIAVDVDPAGLL